MQQVLVCVHAGYAVFTALPAWLVELGYTIAGVVLTSMVLTRGYKPSVASKQLRF